MRRFIQIAITLSVLVMVWLLAVLPVARAATLTVCAAGCDHTTIQAAVSAAIPGDIISIMAGTYIENVVVDKDLTLQGVNKNNVIVNGNGSGSVFTVNPGVTVTIADMTITNGAADRGGGVNNQGILTLNNSILINNNVVNHGGGVYNNGGIATINNSTIADNSSLNGAGLMNDNGGVMTVNNSTINNNRRANGGGIYNASGSVTVNNSTISSNSTGFVGGIYSFAPITVTNSTIYNNTIFGFRVWATTGILRNTIVANNTVGNCEAVVGATIVSLGYNLDSDGTCNLGAANDLPNINPLLGPLADNGGDTLTHALASNSPAVDQGSCPGLNFDQRDLPRPVDVSGIANADDGCDKGAYELSGPDLALTKLVEPATAVFPGAPITYTLIFSNIGGSVATGVLISDIVPLTLTNLGFSSSGATITNTGLSPNYCWNVENLAPSQGGVITVTGQITSNLTGDIIFTNTATITSSTLDLNITNNSAEAGVQVVVPELSIRKTVVPDTDVPYRGEITYTIVLSNGNAFDISNASLTDTLPISTTFAGWVQQSGAGENNDQITWNGTVTAGQSITFTFVANYVGDYNEVVTNFAEYSHAGSSGSAQASFTVEPGPPAVSINDVNVIEGNSGVGVATFDVILSIASTKTVTVTYATADGTAAVADNDYMVASGTLSFSPGRTQEAITVTINGDTRIEPDETFYINLLSVTTNGTIADGQGFGIITNDDFASQPPQSPNDGDDDDDDDESDGSLPETPPRVPTSTAAPLPVQTLPETGMYEPESSSLWVVISLLGIGGAIVWLSSRRYR